jgi:hypothetical protein
MNNLYKPHSRRIIEKSSATKVNITNTFSNILQSHLDLFCNSDIKRIKAFTLILFLFLFVESQVRDDIGLNHHGVDDLGTLSSWVVAPNQESNL